MSSSPEADVSSEAAFARSRESLGASATSRESPKHLRMIPLKRQMSKSNLAITLEAKLADAAAGKEGGARGGREACAAEERHGVRRGRHAGAPAYSYLYG